MNQLVGNLENALGSSRPNVVPSGNPVNVSAGKQTSVGQISQAVSSQIITSVKSSSSLNKTASPKINGTDNHANKNLAIQNSSPAPKSSNVSVSAPAPQPVINRQTPSPVGVVASSVNNVMRAKVPKVAVPIAPRLGNIMITPRQAQLIMAQQPFANPQLIRSNLIARMPGTIPVMPRIPGPGIAVPPVMNTQIPGLAAVPRGAIINMSQKHDPRIIRMPLSTTTLTQVKGVTTSVPGQVNYRFRQMNPSSTTTEQSGTTSVANGVSTTNATANVTVMRESVKRLKEFFQNLIIA